MALRSTSWLRTAILSVGALAASPIAAAGPTPGARAQAMASGGATGAAVARAADTAAVEEVGPTSYGDLAPDACLRQLDERAIAYERLERAHGVDAPIRLVGPLRGVAFRHAGAARTSATREILDCRLLLALDDFAARLAPRGVVAVEHFGIYRGDLPLPRRGPPLHHVAGLAIDVAGFVKDDGARIAVRLDWSRSLGPKTCGGEPPGGASRALELRAIACDLVESGPFQEVLTPNHDTKHLDHLHLEVVRHAERRMID